VEQGFRGALPHACGTMFACKRACALHGSLRSTSAAPPTLQFFKFIWTIVHEADKPHQVGPIGAHVIPIIIPFMEYAYPETWLPQCIADK
jgi:hypothetical protein